MPVLAIHDAVREVLSNDAPSGFEDVPAIMSPAQLAKVLNVSVRTLERWREANSGPDYQHPRKTRIYRYYRSDLFAWLENKKPAAVTAGQTKNQENRNV